MHLVNFSPERDTETFMVVDRTSSSGQRNRLFLCAIVTAVGVAISCRPPAETATTVTQQQPPEVPPEVIETFSSAAEALESLLRREKNVEVIAFGEYHQSSETARVPSSLKRFTEELLPVLEGKASDLIIETWIPAQGCEQNQGKVVEKVAEQVAEQVQKVTKRTDTTEQEVIALIEKSRASAIRPHILEMGCSDYESVFVEGEVDYDRLLRVLTRLLREKTIQLRDIRARRAGRAPFTVVVYGGDIHNDLYPQAEIEPYSYGPLLDKMLVGHYLEVDLYVPEYIANDERLAGQNWFSSFQNRQSEEHVLLFKRGPSSYVLVFRRTGD